MIKLRNKSFVVRKVVATAIIIHGLYRVATVTNYIDFVSDNFDSIISNQSLLIMGATILPFLEFLAGALLFMKVGVKRSAIMAAVISLVMGAFIIVGHLYFLRLVYHMLVIGALTYVFIAYRPIILNETEFNLSKRKVNSWKYYFFRLW